ncbi:MAG: Stk1 family PASTA domain-containing Ser/Thr kinase [Solirubrobacteraceae bacterium]|jgi:serine/threonine-protein kinase
MLTITPGTIIDDRYRVVSRVGSGGMADVYAAEDLQLGRRVALKLLHERFAQDQEFVERFRREAKSAASLSHANIVSVFDRGEWHGTYYIAMELLEGRSLDQIVREEAPLTPERAIEMTEQVLRAARFAHRNGIVHRDLKPHNVIVDGEGRIKVTDFGIASAGASEITQTGSIMGTARYLSPEQAQGEPSGPSTDLYAIGILLYELLTGTVPFEGDSVVAIALRHLSEPPRPPSTLVSSISPNLDAIVLKALAKDPANRFADADEFLAALAGERERLRAEDGSRTASFSPLALAPSTAIAPTPAHTLVPASGAYVEPTYWDSTSQTSVSGPPPGQGSRGPIWPWALLGTAVIAAAIVVALLVLTPAHSTVPSVVGDTQFKAVQALAGFNPVATQEPSSAPAGIVLKQNPAAGTVLAKGSTVSITVSSGAAPGIVPNLVGETQAAAEAALHKAGYRYTTTTQSSSNVKNGLVISSSPSAGSSANRGSVVALTVSSGAQQVNLPPVTNLPFPTAEAALLGAGFRVKKVPVPSEYAPGQVLTESPATPKAPQGSLVTLTVAEAPKTVVVPDEIGQPEASAVQALTAAGLTSSTTSVTVTNPAQNGLVVSEVPAPGSRVKKTSTIALVIGSYTGSTGSSSGPTGTTGTS